MAVLFSPSTSPVVKAAVAAALVTGGLGGFLVLRQLSSKPHSVPEPPPLQWNESLEPVVMPAEPPPSASPALYTKPLPNFVAQPPLPDAKELPVSKLPRDRLNAALGAAKDPTRKLEILRRLENEPNPTSHYAASGMFVDADKTVRLEALRIVEKLDTTNSVLMPKVHAVYRYEHDPEVKAQLDRLVQKFRPEEEARWREREEAMRLEALAPLPPP